MFYCPYIFLEVIFVPISTNLESVYNVAVFLTFVLIFAWHIFCHFSTFCKLWMQVLKKEDFSKKIQNIYSTKGFLQENSWSVPYQSTIVYYSSEFLRKKYRQIQDFWCLVGNTVNKPSKESIHRPKCISAILDKLLTSPKEYF
jgi:hypothetical protein